MRRALALTILLLLASHGAHACFGKMLRVGVEPGRERALAAYATGMFIAEKTGIEPEFIEVPSAAEALEKGMVDLAVLAAPAPEVREAVTRPAGEIPGLGGAKFVVRGEVLDDLRFFTVDKALGLAPGFFGSKAYSLALSSGAEPKKAARRAVNDGT